MLSDERTPQVGYQPSIVAKNLVSDQIRYGRGTSIIWVCAICQEPALIDVIIIATKRISRQSYNYRIYNALLFRTDSSTDNGRYETLNPNDLVYDMS